MTIARIGAQFQVNTTTSREQLESSVTALADGRFVVTYTDYSGSADDTSSTAIRARIFNADGTQSVPEFLVNTTTSNSQFQSSVTALADGRFVVTYGDSSTSGGDTSFNAIRARIFNSDGTQSVPEFLVNTTTNNGQSDSSVTALADGRFVVTYSDFSGSGGDTSDFAIRARIFNADGTQSVPEFLVNTTTLNSQYESCVTALADGRFIVTYTDESASGGDTDSAAIRARIFNADGTQSVPEFLVNTTTSFIQLESSVAALADGRIVVTYTDFSATGGDTSGGAIRARIFNADGTQSVPEFLVNTTTLSTQRDSQVTALADGRFVVTYTDFSSTGDDTSSLAIRARIFNADGTQSIPEFLVNTTTFSNQVDSSVAAMADGRFVVTYSDENSSGDSFGGVRSQIFDPTRFDGTAGADTVTGGNFDDRYLGYGGEDVMSGRGGDDYLNGGEGSDTLSGDDGNDRLEGGNSADFLYGGTGDDLVFGGAGIDQLFGDAGNDSLYGGVGADTINGGADFDLARYDQAATGVYARLDGVAGSYGEAAGDTFTAIEGLVGSYFADILVGSANTDFLFGSIGADTLYGLGGADTLDGGAGNDNLYGGTGADALIGGADFDLARYDDATSGVYARLDGVAGSYGDAAGDTFNSIEGLVGSGFADILVGSANADTLTGSGGIDTLYGLGGSDTMFGGADGDTLDGGAGNDSLYGGAGADTLNGGADFDLARYDDAGSSVYARLDGVAGSYGDAAGDTFSSIEGLVGSDFADILVGSANADYLLGLGGADTIYGLAGADYIDGGLGNDSLYGGTSADQFVFSTALNAATNVDGIMDFAVNVDDILLSQAIFTQIGTGLDGAEFQLGTAANDAGDRIIYNQATGQLYYDANGNVNGSADQILFATVTAGTALTINDFVMVA
jgi:Ca2+-binding RTX toxin-like protein